MPWWRQPRLPCVLIFPPHLIWPQSQLPWLPWEPASHGRSHGQLPWNPMLGTVVPLGHITPHLERDSDTPKVTLPMQARTWG